MAGVFMLKKYFVLFLVISAAFFSGCRSVPMAKPELDAAAKEFKTNPNGAQIYIYRNELLGGQIKIDVRLNGVEVGKTLQNTYILLEVPPGKHKLESESENTSVLELDTEKGKNYFVWQEAKVGLWLARNKLQSVDESTGKKGVLECKRIETVK